MSIGTRKKASKCNNNAFWRNPTTGQTFPAGTVSLIERRKLEYWDSQLEFKVYCELRKLFKADYIYRQHTLFILPKTDVFPALTWDVDFAVITPSETFFVEAKGRWILTDKGELSNFCKLLRFLSMSNPEVFSKLQIVSDSAWKIGTSKLTTIPLRNLSNEYRLNVG